jgi:hypothetical protein
MRVAPDVLEKRRQTVADRDANQAARTDTKAKGNDGGQRVQEHIFCAMNPRTTALPL